MAQFSVEIIRLPGSLLSGNQHLARFMDDLEAGACEIAMFGIGQTPARAQRVALSNPHLRSGVFAITTSANPRVGKWEDIDKEGNVIAVQAGTFMEPFMRQNMKHASMLLVNKPAAREEAVLSGRADAFLTDFPYAMRMRFQHDWARVLAPKKPVGETSYGFAMRKDDPAWKERVDLFVKAVKDDGRLKAISARHGLTTIMVKD